MLALHVRPERHLHPFLALAASLPVFIAGLFLVGGIMGWVYPLVVAVFYFCFGYGKAWFRATLIGLPIILIAAGLSCISLPVARAALIVLRTYLLLLGSVLTLSIEPVRLLRALQQIHFPRLLCIGILITLRFFSVLAAEIRRIRMALRSRGIASAWRRPGLLLRAYLMPLLLRIFSISDLLALSLETRGFDRDGQSSLYRRIRWSIRDSVFCIVLILLIGGLQLVPAII